MLPFLLYAPRTDSLWEVHIRILNDLARRAVAALLLCLVPAWGLPQDADGGGLKILIIEGEGAVNNIRLRTAREPIVEIRDRNNRPVAGALVLFKLPVSGPGGAFPGGAQTLSVTTNQAGRAVASGLQPNQVAGKFQIDVEAQFQGQTAKTSIHQQNRLKARWLTPKKAVLIGAVVVAVIVAAVVASGGGSSTDVALGRPTVGPK